MRKFLIEMDVEITLDEVEQNYHEFDYDDVMTFPQYLADCLGKNGALTEILTDETPRGEEMRAVSLCRVQYSEDEDDYCEEWLTPTEIYEKWRDGCGIKYLD
jgi:hypothetical protein